VIEEILQPPVSAVDIFGDVLDEELFPEEEALVRSSVAKRRRDFTTGRACARRALAGLGRAPIPIVTGLRGEPIWPPGIVGSITHCDGYRAAAVASDREMLTIGVDAEPNEPLPDGVLDLVADAGEKAWITRLAAREPAVCWDRLLFSAKESVYKAWFPLAHRWLDFHEATVTVEGGGFEAQLLVAGPSRCGQPITGFRGRWLVERGVIVTAISVLRAGGPN
jgi:4'-phosphopantetheinyl transferase EntD